MVWIEILISSRLMVMGEIYISLEVEEAEDFGLGGELRGEVLLVDHLGVDGLL